MNTTGQDDSRPRDITNWATHVGPLAQPDAPEDAINLNVGGRELTGPLQGFGKLWQKAYEITLTGVDVTPQEVIVAWKANYGEFWPAGNNFYAPLAGIQPGEVGLINADMPGGMKLSTGVMVLYADDVSFTYMTPQGHPFAGWITFSASRTASGASAAKVEVLMRAQDPASEIGLALGGHRTEDRMWEQTLRNVAAHFSVQDADVVTTITCVDNKRQWRNASNLKHDAVMHTALHLLTAPVRAIGMSWRGLLATATATNVLAHGIALVLAREVIPPLVAIAVLGAAGLLLLGRRERAGAWMLSAVGTLQLASSIPFLAAAMAHPESPVDFLHATFGAITAASMALAGVAVLRRRVGSPRWVAVGGAAALTLLVVGSLVAAASGGSDQRAAGDVNLVAERGAWATSEVTVETGAFVFVTNRDLFRHTFVVDDLGIEVELPVGRSRRIPVVADPGTYAFYCSVPGHEGMTATLLVDADEGPQP